MSLAPPPACPALATPPAYVSTLPRVDEEWFGSRNPPQPPPPQRPTLS
ncbi:MAG: hypothetical protein AAFV43_11975 [Planctomycetota bacterium]